MMRFLIDQDVYAVTTRFLITGEHDVVPVTAIGMSEAADEEILRTAQEQNRILVTRDRDYGNLVFVRGMGSGVIYLRIQFEDVNEVHNQLTRVLETYSEVELCGAFVVIKSDGYRFRRPSL
jgi:predicted nuclease of predicted toxin-antitoxin system